MERGALGRLLRMERVGSGLTVREIAERLNMSAMTVSNLERGTRVPNDRASLEAIAVAYGLPARDVYRAALESRAASGAVELPTDGERPVAETALALARAWRDLTEEDMEEIRRIVSRHDEGPDE